MHQRKVTLLFNLSFFVIFGENYTRMDKTNTWKTLFWAALALFLLLLGGVVWKWPRSASEKPVITEDIMAEPVTSMAPEAPQPLNHYALKGSVAAGGYTEFVPSSDYRIEEDSRGVTFVSPQGKKLLRCDIMEHLEARWPDPEDPALLRYRTVYEDWGYRAVFEYVEEWPDGAGGIRFKLGPVAFFRSPGM